MPEQPDIKYTSESSVSPIEEKSLIWAWTDGSKFHRQSNIGPLDIPEFTVSGQIPKSPAARCRSAARSENVACRSSFNSDSPKPWGRVLQRIRLDSARRDLSRWHFDNGIQTAFGIHRQGAPSNPDKTKNLGA